MPNPPIFPWTPFSATEVSDKPVIYWCEIGRQTTTGFNHDSFTLNSPVGDKFCVRYVRGRAMVYRADGRGEPTGTPVVDDQDGARTALESRDRSIFTLLDMLARGVRL